MLCLGTMRARNCFEYLVEYILSLKWEPFDPLRSTDSVIHKILKDIKADDTADATFNVKQRLCNICHKKDIELVCIFLDIVQHVLKLISWLIFNTQPSQLARIHDVVECCRRWRISLRIMFPKPFFKIVRFNFEYLCMIRFFVALFWLRFYQIFPRGVGLLYFVWQIFPRGPRVQSLVHEGAGFGPHSSFFGRQLLLSLFPISHSQSLRCQNNRYKGSPRRNDKELPAKEARQAKFPALFS